MDRAGTRLLRHFLPQFLGELFHLLEVLGEILGQQAFL
jgi:hypothetical protein